MFRRLTSMFRRLPPALRRRPRFALLLVAILAPVVALVAVLSLAGHGQGSPPTLARPRPSRQCVVAPAQAQVRVHQLVKATARASIPVSVTEQATTNGRTISVTRSTTVVEVATEARPITVIETAAASRRACAAGDSAQAARGAALSRAYAFALGPAHTAASAGARRRLRALVPGVAASALSQARGLARSRARAAAAAQRGALAKLALDEAKAG